MNTKLKPITDFDSLTDQQRDQLHHWLEEGIATRTVMTRLKDEFGFVITYNKLYRYAQRLLQARTLSEQRENRLTVTTFLDLLNGNPIPYDEAGLALIQKRAFEAACAPKLRISQLATLQRVFHYKTARAECVRRAAQNDRRNDIAERSLQLRQEQHQARVDGRLSPARNLNPNLFSPDEVISRDAITNNDATPPITDLPITDHSPSSPSALKSFLSPEVIANTNLYDQKIDCGEIRVIYAPGKHYEIEYCNPADAPALERLHKSAPLRFFEDPTRTTFLPPLRTFGKNPYIPPTDHGLPATNQTSEIKNQKSETLTTQNSGLSTQNLEAEGV